jgi:hypothetical protein
MQGLGTQDGADLPGDCYFLLRIRCDSVERSSLARSLLLCSRRTCGHGIGDRYRFPVAERGGASAAFPTDRILCWFAGPVLRQLCRSRRDRDRPTQALRFLQGSWTICKKFTSPPQPRHAARTSFREKNIPFFRRVVKLAFCPLVGKDLDWYLRRRPSQSRPAVLGELDPGAALTLCGETEGIGVELSVIFWFFHLDFLWIERC